MNNLNMKHTFGIFLGVILLFVSYGCGGKEAAPKTITNEVKKVTAPAAPAEGIIAVPVSGAKITGTVKFTGNAPKMRELYMSDEPVCVHKWEECRRHYEGFLSLLGYWRYVNKYDPRVK